MLSSGVLGAEILKFSRARFVAQPVVQEELVEKDNFMYYSKISTPLPGKYSVLFCYMANVGIIICPEAKVMSTF